jgi:hypothetical protein
MQSIHRRDLLRVTATGAAIASAGGLVTSGQLLHAQSSQGAQRPAPLDRERVNQFVRAAHADLEKVKAMLAETPGLVNATWDWGGGDFETALGGASHMGRVDIAEHLLSNGARLDVFCAAMLGKTDVVKACVADDPAIVHVKGPHGISLLRHAQAGKQDAMIALLSSAGAT